MNPAHVALADPQLEVVLHGAAPGSRQVHEDHGWSTGSAPSGVGQGRPQTTPRPPGQPVTANQTRLPHHLRAQCIERVPAESASTNLPTVLVTPIAWGGSGGAGPP